jgi:dienelactone hydrolase
MFKRENKSVLCVLSRLFIFGILIISISSVQSHANDENSYRDVMVSMAKWLYGVDRNPEDYKKMEPIVEEFFENARQAGFYPGEIVQSVFEHTYDPKFRPQVDHVELSQMNVEIHEAFQRLSQGVLDYQRTSYKSNVDGLDIPAYVFQPLKKRGKRGHPALVWAHGGIAGNFSDLRFPFVRQAVERGYVVVAPEYRGSIGWGADFYNEWDWEHEEGDVASAVDYIKDNLPHVDLERIGMIGWSHGGMITMYQSIYNPELFKCGAASVPVNNLFIEYAYRGPLFNMFLATQERFRGLPHDNFEMFKAASLVYHVDKLTIPLLVHVADNDEDVLWEEGELLVNTLKVKQPDLAEVRVYHDPPGGHGFSLMVDEETMEIKQSKALRDSWNRIWAFLEYHLEPYRDNSVN